MDRLTSPGAPVASVIFAIAMALISAVAFVDLAVIVLQ
jgi:hypothetical protein